jgi:hypothetical protein
MKVTFYVSPEGDVLSTKEHPVKSRFLMFRSLDRDPIPAEAVSELELTQSMLGMTIYKAVTVTIPDDYFAAKDGIVR